MGQNQKLEEEGNILQQKKHGDRETQETEKRRWQETWKYPELLSS